MALSMATLSIQRARQLLGNKAYRLSDAEIQAEIDIMMVLANRVYDVLERKNSKKYEHRNTERK